MIVAALLIAGCGGGEPDEPVGEPSTSSADELDVRLQAELVAMFERDQAQRLGRPVPEPADETDQQRTDRLAEIVDEHGWPGYALVGEEGEEAAWTIAQHSDLDPAFQAEALELLRAAVEDGDASPGNLAYLDDRVAVAAGRPQSYGTQVGCGPKGPSPATPIDDEAGLEQRRADAGLDPYADYLAEMATVCAADG